jgi:hypothetical protein
MKSKNKYKFAVGIPSYNEASNISFVTQQIDEGIKEYFNPDEAVILNIDCKSNDRTKEVFLNTKTTTTKKCIESPLGKGRAILAFFRYCVENKILYVATFDSDLKSIKPNWVPNMLNPIIRGYDLTIPVYTRNRFEANITNHFAYPLIFANYGINIRQPLGGEFGYSLNFLKYLIKQKKHPKTFLYGIDIFITINALVGGFKVAESYLSKKIHSPSYYHMESTFRQVFESGLFTTKINRDKKEIYEGFEKLDNQSGIDTVTYFPHKIHIPKLMEQLKKRFNRYNNAGLYKKYIGDEPLMAKISKIINENDTGTLNESLWTDYLLLLLRNYNSSNNLKLNVLSRITVPIYRWRVLTYWLQSENLTPEESESIIKCQALLLKRKFDTISAKI